LGKVLTGVIFEIPYIFIGPVKGKHIGDGFKALFSVFRSIILFGRLLCDIWVLKCLRL